MADTNPGKRIERRISQNLRKVRTMLPGVVSKVYKDKLKVDVFVKTVTKDTPIHISEVRVVYPQSMNSKILFNLEIGDTVMLLFSKHSLDALISDSFINVGTDDRFNLEDVVALPGIQLDKNQRDNSEHSSIQGMDVEIPDGIHILSNDKIHIIGDTVDINNIDNLRFNDGTSMTGGNFNGLGDTPDDYDDDGGKVVAVKTSEDGLEFIEIGDIQVDEFLNLTDTPSSYDTHSGDVVSVNDSEDGLEFSERGDLREFELKVKLYVGEDEPQLEDREVAFWNENGSLWLMYNIDGDNGMVELS